MILSLAEVLQVLILPILLSKPHQRVLALPQVLARYFYFPRFEYWARSCLAYPRLTWASMCQLVRLWIGVQLKF